MSTHMRPWRRTLLPLATIVAAFMFAGSALGATEPDPVATADPFVVSASPAPSCVTITLHTHWTRLIKHVHVHNGCSSQVRVKIIIVHGQDSECHPINRGADWTFNYPMAARFDGINSC